MTYFCMTNCDNMLIISLKVVLIVTFSSITAMADSEMFQRGGWCGGARGGDQTSDGTFPKCSPSVMMTQIYLKIPNCYALR